MSEGKPTAMVSSTVLDLPVHRERVGDACMRAGHFALMQETGSAVDQDTVARSIAMVDECDAYIGVLGARYGTVPPGETRSITEIEYDRAIERGIPRLLFIMHEDHDVKQRDVEKIHVAELHRLRRRWIDDRVLGEYRDAAELHALVLQSLLKRRGAVTAALHSVTDAPLPPKAYVAHTYALQTTRGLVGRQAELRSLTDWVTRPDDKRYAARVLAVEAVGGMGKSALTWKWFSDVAPQEMQLAGQMWWSFYESDASYGNFLTRALAYATGRTFAEVERLAVSDREEQLLRVLDARPFLIVLDGFERALQAYAPTGAAQAVDADLDQQALDAQATESPALAALINPLSEEHQLRRTIDPRCGAFLRRLTQVRASRVLLSTRLFPTELQTDADVPRPGAARIVLSGLSDDDAVDLWRELGVSGRREELLALFQTFENYPLLIRILAGEVAGFRPAPGDFAAWREHHHDFNPFGLSLTQVRSHVLEFALRGLSERQLRLLHTIAASRAPAAYDLLRELLVGAGRPFGDDHQLATDLEALEDRGLIGWDQRANRYDQHPIVRGVAWTALDQRSRRSIHEAFEEYFASLPPRKDVASVDELHGPLEHLNALLQLGRHREAWELLDGISDSLWRLGEAAMIGELALGFFDPDTGLPYDVADDGMLDPLLTVALTCHISGQLDKDIPLFYKVLAIMKADDLPAVVLILLARSRLARGELADAEMVATRAVAMIEADAETYDDATLLAARAVLGAVLLILGREREARPLILSAGEIEDEDLYELLGLDAIIVRSWLTVGDVEAARAAVDASRKQMTDESTRARVTVVEGLEAEVAMAAGATDEARERLLRTLEQAGALRLIEPSVHARLAYAELELRARQLDSARERTIEAIELAQRAPFRLLLADAFALRARIEVVAGDHAAAAEQAAHSYRHARADGPPHTYAAAVARAETLLRELGETVPEGVPSLDQGESLVDSLPDEFAKQIVRRQREEALAQLESRHGHVRAAGVRLLGQMDSDDTVDMLGPLVDDEDPLVRIALAGSLPLTSVTGPNFAAFAADEDPRVRASAVATMARKVKTEEAVATVALLEAAGIPEVATARYDDAEEEVAIAALRLAQVVVETVMESPNKVHDTWPGRPSDVGPETHARVTRWIDAPHLWRLGTSAHSAVRRETAGVLVELPGEVPVKLLPALAADAEASVRAAAGRAIVERGWTDDPVLTDAIQRLLCDPEAPVRRMVLAALFDTARRTAPYPSHDPHRSVGALLEPAVGTLRHAPVEVADTWTSGLGGLMRGGAVLESAWSALLDHIDPEIRRRAREEVPSAIAVQVSRVIEKHWTELGEPDAKLILGMSRRIPGPPASLLLSLLDVSLPGLRAAAIDGLGRSDDPAVLKRILTLLDDADHEVVIAVVRGAIRHLNVSDEVVVSLAAAPAARRRAVEAVLLGRRGAPNAAERLREVLEDEVPAVVVVAANALERLGASDGRAVVAALGASSRSEDRLAAVDAYAAWPAELAFPALDSLFADENRAVRIAALHAALRVRRLLAIAHYRTALAEGDALLSEHAMDHFIQLLDYPDRVLLSHDGAGWGPYQAADEPIDKPRVEAAAARLELAVDDVKRRYRELGSRFPLVLAFDNEDAAARPT